MRASTQKCFLYHAFLHSKEDFDGLDRATIRNPFARRDSISLYSKNMMDVRFFIHLFKLDTIALRYLRHTVLCLNNTSTLYLRPANAKLRMCPVHAGNGPTTPATMRRRSILKGKHIKINLYNSLMFAFQILWAFTLSPGWNWFPFPDSFYIFLIHRQRGWCTKGWKTWKKWQHIYIKYKWNR